MDKITSIIATAAALAFVTAPISSTLVQAKENKIFCYGVNSCKGKSDCSTAEAVCKGENTCKGRGYLSMTKEQCEKAGGTVKIPPLIIK